MNLPLTGTDLWWWGGFALVAVMLLVRLMMGRRNEVLTELQSQVAEQQIQKKNAEKADKAGKKKEPPQRKAA